MRRVAVLALICLVGTTAAAEPKRAKAPKRETTMNVTATAYCEDGKTQSGVRTRTGILAADPAVIPVGSVVRIVDGATKGIYTVMDTGSAVKGRRIDIFMPDCGRAKQFGERPVRVRVLRRGWDPRNSSQ